MKNKNKEIFLEPELLTIDVPEGWEKKTLLEVAGGESSLIVGGPFGSSLQVKDYKNEGIPIIRLQNIGKLKFIDKDIKFISTEKAKELEYHTFVKGDLVLAKLGDPIGKTCIIPEKYKWGIVVSDVVRIRLQNENIDKKFLLCYLNSPLCISQINSQVFGSTRPRVNLKEIRDISVLLPPLPEQHRIVARVEALLSQINAARDRLNRVPLIMKKFRQAVLAAACSGRLTEGWREEHPDIENVADFIKKLKKEKLTLDKKRMRYLSDLDFSECHEIPETWGWVKLGEISIAVDVDHKMPKATEKGIPLISPKDFVEPDKIDFKDAKKISHNDYERMSRKITPESGDILLSRYGTIGKVRKVPLDQKFQISYSLCLIRPFLDLRRNDYLYWILKSTHIYHQALANDRSSSIPDLGIKDINNFTIPLPPLSEQHEIVHRVDILFALGDQIEQKVAEATKRTEVLTQAVLAKAFRGEL